MTTVGPNSPATTTDDATVGTAAWTSPNNAQVSDAVYATVVGGSLALISHYIKATNYGFSIPGGATINGILVEVEKKSSISNSTNHTVDNSVKIVKSTGSFGSTEKADTTTLWPLTEAYASYGGSADLWGETWAVSDINSSNFGVGFSSNSKGQTGPSCLHGDTLVRTIKGHKKIKNLKPGDRIYSYNEETRKAEHDVINSVGFELMSVNRNKYFVITTSDGNTIRATDTHRIYADAGRGFDWTYAPDVKAGDVLLNEKLQRITVVNAEEEENYENFVWNLEVAKNPNFFAANMLVHNGVTVTSSVDHIRISVTYTTGGGHAGNLLMFFMSLIAAVGLTHLSFFLSKLLGLVHTQSSGPQLLQC